MVELLGVVIVFLLLGLAAILRRGLNEIIKGLESIDERLARLQPDAAEARP